MWRYALIAMLVLGGAPAVAGESQVSRARLDAIMSAWPDEVRANAERLIDRYGLPDRVTATVLVWDVHSVAQQQAMVKAAGERRHSAEAGEAEAPLLLLRN